MSRRSILLLWLVSGAAVSALQNRHWRFSASSDTISYFDVASKYWHGHSADAVVQMWSPLYSWLLMPIMSLPREQHFPAAHALNVLLFILVALAAWRLVTMLSRIGAAPSNSEIVFVLGVATTAALNVIPTRYLTPDLLGLAVVLWLVSRICEEAAIPIDGTWRRGATGAVWGVGYMGRTFVFPYGGAVLLLASLIVRRNRSIAQHARWIAPYVVGFVIVASPWIATLSKSVGHLTLGQAGTNNILAALHRDPIQPLAWPLEMADGRIHNFERPFPTTLPEAYDVVIGGPYRYHDVVRTYARIIVGNVEALFFGFYGPDMPLFWPLGILAVLACVVFAGAVPVDRRVDVGWWLLIAGALGLAMFVAVHVESRYVAPFLVILAAAIACRSASLTADRRAVSATILALFGVWFWLFPGVVWLDGMRSSRAYDRNVQPAETRWLATHGTRYAAVGATYDLAPAAWVSDTSIIASVDPKDATPETCDALARQLRALNVDGVMSRGSSECGPWEPVPGAGWVFWNLR